MSILVAVETVLVLNVPCFLAPKLLFLTSSSGDLPAARAIPRGGGGGSVHHGQALPLHIPTGGRNGSKVAVGKVSGKLSGPPKMRGPIE